jgi:hypothetical protein
MKSPAIQSEPRNEDRDLISTSYSPTLRVIVVAAIFVVAVFLLAGCGSKAKTATPPVSTPTQSAVVTPSASASVTNSLTCNSDKSSDSINPGKYFGSILAQVKKEWNADAVISSVRFERQYVKSFQDLCTLKTDSNWQMVFYSLSGKNEISGALDNSKKDATGVPPVVFSVDKTDNSASTYLSFADMTKQGGWKFHEFSRPETYASESKYSANLFLGWKMSMSEVVQKLIDRVRNEKITGAGFFVYDGKASLKTKTPYVWIYWQNGEAKTSYYVEPISLQDYDIKS